MKCTTSAIIEIITKIRYEDVKCQNNKLDITVQTVTKPEKM